MKLALAALNAERPGPEPNRCLGAFGSVSGRSLVGYRSRWRSNLTRRFSNCFDVDQWAANRGGLFSPTLHNYGVALDLHRIGFQRVTHGIELVGTRV
jgi:hypothetical protein